MTIRTIILLNDFTFYCFIDIQYLILTLQCAGYRQDNVAAMTFIFHV